jgi:integrase
MDDPALSEIGRPMIAEYRRRLQTLPIDLYQSRRRHGVTSLVDLIKVVKLAGEPHMSQKTANRYLRRLSEMLNWAVVDELMPRNPAAGVGDVGKKGKREQDERAIFDDADLAKIFGVEWFKTGKGQQTKREDSRFYQPHYYWLPLLGLYSGGRLNELSQLYLDDVKKNEDGCWYLDFNLDGSDKIDADPKLVSIANQDKSLKTVNSHRVVTLHDQIVTLGLPKYVQALRDAGHVRLFPELRFDKVKGYGKAAGAWFNERFLGNHLKIPRDGTKTFHSLRHMFITELFDKEVPEATVAQLAGHVRGETMSAQRYRKDQNASKLQPYINRLVFTLPTVTPFDVAAGVLAVDSALDRKRRHPGAKV